MLQKQDCELLSKILGKDNFYTDPAHLLSYSYDATRISFKPDAVAFVRDEEQISKVLKYCNERKIVIVPRGAGSGFTGGALPANGGIILSFEKYMNKILEIDLKNLVARVQPGVLNKDFQDEVEKLDLFYPPDPASQSFSTLGGNVSENAGGMRASKYGITKDYVMALRAVLPNGNIIRAGKKTIKDVAGYNIAGILTGSEGTLAVISEITLKLLPKPKLTKTAIGVFNSIEDAMNAVFKTFAAGVIPVAMEFLDDLVIKALLHFNPTLKVIPKDAKAVLITNVDGNYDNVLQDELEQLEAIFKDNHAIAFQIAKNAKEVNDIWFARRNASPSLKFYGQTKINEDVTVPRSVLPEFLAQIKSIGKQYGHDIPCFGHAGDGNVHVNVMTDKNNKVKFEKAEEAVHKIFELSVAMQGTLSGEHGIGLSKAPFMDVAFSSEERQLFKTLKTAFDPNNILNPYKMGLDG